ncbi:hypothetical protein PLICRDRAFT_51013 [Plicaturopsis crispa FD-325 SS-3]|nr:hypothetical protein PLICRDRAFT_51013 [Plicaturopsis crispa FD-325 SS-3]
MAISKDVERKRYSREMAAHTMRQRNTVRAKIEKQKQKYAGTGISQEEYSPDDNYIDTPGFTAPLSR